MEQLVIQEMGQIYSKDIHYHGGGGLGKRIVGA